MVDLFFFSLFVFGVRICVCECFLKILPKIIMPIIVSVDLLSAAAFQIQMTEPNCVSKYKNDRRRRSCGILAGRVWAWANESAAETASAQREQSRVWVREGEKESEHSA